MDLLAPGPTRLGSPCSLELVRAAKAAAAVEGINFNEWIKRAVEEKLEGLKPKPQLAPAPSIAAATIGDLQPCPCGGKCVPWGPTKKHCTKCGRNHELP